MQRSALAAKTQRGGKVRGLAVLPSVVAPVAHAATTAEVVVSQVTGTPEWDVTDKPVVLDAGIVPPVTPLEPTPKPTPKPGLPKMGHVTPSGPTP